MLTTLGTAQRRSLLTRGRSKPRSAAPDPEAVPVVTSRATLVAAEPFASQAAADAWRAAVDPVAEAREAVAVLNRVLHAQRTAAADPAVREVTLRGALAARVGTGEGEQVAHGRWSDAVELPPAQAGRVAERSSSVLRPQERLAAILGGRDVALACEELALRARLDLDADRSREAALQLRVALECALAELAPWGDRERIAPRLQDLREERAAVAAAANAALEGGLDDETADDVQRILELLEAALRARTTIALE